MFVGIAEQRLGMSSLKLHGAHEVAKFMPKGMQYAGNAMHHSASQFATVAKDKSVTGDLKPALASLAKVNQTCVACHAGYRLNCSPLFNSAPGDAPVSAKGPCLAASAPQTPLQRRT